MRITDERLAEFETLDFIDRLSNKEAELLQFLKAERERTCKWTKTVLGLYGEYDDWATECGEDFAIVEEWHETPTKYCSNCGGKTVDTLEQSE